LADREDSIHIKIKIDVDPQDKEFVENLSQNIAKADEGVIASKKTTKQKPDLTTVPTFEELETRYLKKFIDKIEKEMGKKDSKDPEVILGRLQAKKDRLLLKQWKEGPVGKLHNFTSSQFANLRQAATNPGAFLLGAFTKKLGKYGAAATKGGIYAIIALIAYEAVLFVIDQLMKPGRWLDRRYRRISREETLNFYERTLQEDIRHGYQEIRVTTIQGLRGGTSQVNGNLFEFSSTTTGILQSSPYRSSQQVYGHAYLSGSGIDNRGNPRRRTVSGRFG